MPVLPSSFMEGRLTWAEFCSYYSGAWKKNKRSEWFMVYEMCAAFPELGCFSEIMKEPDPEVLLYCWLKGYGAHGDMCAGRELLQRLLLQREDRGRDQRCVARSSGNAGTCEFMKCVHDLSVRVCLCFFLAVRDFALARVQRCGKGTVPTRSAWSFRSLEKKYASGLAREMSPYIRLGPEGICYGPELVSWSICELLSLALNCHRSKRHMSWEGFYLTEAERIAVWETALCFFYQDDSEPGYVRV